MESAWDVRRRREDERHSRHAKSSLHRTRLIHRSYHRDGIIAIRFLQCDQLQVLVGIGFPEHGYRVIVDFGAMGNSGHENEKKTWEVHGDCR